MSPTRREFLAAISAAAAVGNLADPTSVSGQLPASSNQFSERKTDMIPAVKDDLPTPCLLLDLDLFEANIQKMAAHAASAGKKLRPHAKTHKCVEIARRQVAAGAIGISVATVPEAELMVGAGLPGVHLTSPLATGHKVARMVRLLERSPDVSAAVDHPLEVELYEQASAAAGRRMNLMVDLNVGDRRTGIDPGQPALELARRIAGSKHLRLVGLQAYSGSASHVVGFDARRAYSHDVMGKAVETRELLAKNGLPVEILSGASTGTYNIDSQLAGVTELQVGSYAVMDIDYRRIGGRDGELYRDFAHAMTVLSTVVSANHPDRVTIDAGIKAFATDRAFGPEARDVTGAPYRIGGDEFGILTLENPSCPLKLGDRLEFLPPHCDPTVNLYDRIYCCRGQRVEAVWSIMDRYRG